MQRPGSPATNRSRYPHTLIADQGRACGPMTYLIPLFGPRYHDPVGNSVARQFDNKEDPITGMTTPENLRTISLKWRKNDSVLTASLERRQVRAAADRRRKAERRKLHERFEAWVREQETDGRPINLTDINAWLKSSAA